MNQRQRLIVVRGAGEEREYLAALLASALGGPVAHIRGDDIAHRWVVTPLGETRARVEMVYRLLRLVAVSYLKEGYNLVLDAPFIAEIEGTIELRTRDLRDLLRLAHTFREISTGVVTLQTATGAPSHLRAALDADEIDGEVRVIQNIAGDEARAVRTILARLAL